MAATSLRLEPPRAPLRKPSDADMEVPPMEELPAGARKRSPSTDVGSSNGGRDEDGSEDHTCDWDEQDDLNYQMELVGFDEDLNDQDLADHVPRLRARMGWA